MTSEQAVKSVYFTLEKWLGLPPAKAGKVYALKVYPGGRAEVHQVDPDIPLRTIEALEKLRNGSRVYVHTEDAVEVLHARKKDAEYDE